MSNGKIVLPISYKILRHCIKQWIKTQEENDSVWILLKHQGKQPGNKFESNTNDPKPDCNQDSDEDYFFRRDTCLPVMLTIETSVVTPVSVLDLRGFASRAHFPMGRLGGKGIEGRRSLLILQSRTMRAHSHRIRNFSMAPLALTQFLSPQCRISQ
jgi:hypothetical protein